MEHHKIVEKVRVDLESRNAVIRELYNDQKLRSMVGSYVHNNGGSKTDIDDLLTFGVMNFIKQCYRPLFELQKPAEAYVFSIIKYEWMRRAKKKMHVVDEESRTEWTDGMTIENELIGDERMAALKEAMKKLDEKCRSVLTMWASNFKMREIALRLEYKSEGMARKKKHECLGKLKLLTKDI